MTVVLTGYFRFCSFWPPGGISCDGLRKQHLVLDMSLYILVLVYQRVYFGFFNFGHHFALVT